MRQTLRPAPVAPPARLAVAHLAGRFDEAAVAGGAASLQALGFGVDRLSVEPPPTAAPYLAGDDASRRRGLIHALTAPSIDAVVCARGGYGSMRTLARLPDGILADYPKWIVGYSDITAVHLWAFQQGVQSIHGPMVAGLGRHEATGDASIAALLAALRGEPVPLPFHMWLGPRRAVRGPLIGGNLSLLAALRATPLWPSAVDGAILFVEDIGEAPYRIDRMITSLALAGLPGVAALAVGQLTGPDAAAQLASLVEAAAPLDLPILVGLPCGHETPNLAFVHGATYEARDGALVAVSSAAHDPSTLRVASSRGPDQPAAGRGVHVVAADAGARGARWSPASDDPSALLRLAVDAGVCSGAQLVVVRRGDVVADVAAGTLAWGDPSPVTSTTRFDIASVTKAVVTATLAHAAVDDGLLALDDRCPAAFTPGAPTLRDLLRHAAGLPAHVPVFEAARTADDPRRFAEDAFAAVASLRGLGPIYSDVGYVALGRWLAHAFGDGLDAVFASRVAAPLALRAAFLPPPARAALDDAAAQHDAAETDVAATERCAFRGTILRGIVHDENAQVLGGVAGHAGLFASARDVAAVAASLLGHGPRVLAAEGVERMWDVAQIGDGGSFTLGWDTPSVPRSNAGTLMTRGATVGHLGFTGCSVWIDRVRDAVVVLHTNRVHPTRDNASIRWLRPAIHDAAIRTCFD